MNKNLVGFIIGIVLGGAATLGINLGAKWYYLHQQDQVPKQQQEVKAMVVEETIDYCEWCGMHSHHLVAGECPLCREKVAVYLDDYDGVPLGVEADVQHVWNYPIDPPHHWCFNCSGKVVFR